MREANDYELAKGQRNLPQGLAAGHKELQSESGAETDQDSALQEKKTARCRKKRQLAAGMLTVKMKIAKQVQL